jgi:hypothetical protein
LQTTTLWLRSAISAASRLRSSSSEARASRTRSATSFSSASRGEQLIDRLRQHPQLGRTCSGNAQATVGEGRRQLFGHAQRRS